MHFLYHLFKYLQNNDFMFTWPPVFSDEQSAQNLYHSSFYQIMENDETRNQLYKQAIAKLVRDKTVVEVGTGNSAFLPRLCINARAKRVYTIEENDGAFSSSSVQIKALNLDEKIKIYKGFSQDVEIGEKGDIFLHEIIGSLGSPEGAALITEDAKKRFLKPEAQFIPYRCVTKIAPVQPLQFSLANRLADQIFNGLDILSVLFFHRLYLNTNSML